MSKAIVESFTIGNGIPSERLQRALGSEIKIDVANQELYVPVGKEIKIASVGDTIQCYEDGTYDVLKGG